MNLSYSRGIALVLCAGVFWSFIPVGVRQFQVADVWQILIFRSIGVLPLVYALIHVSSSGNSYQAIFNVGRSGLIGAVGLVAAYAGGIAAVRETTIANAAFLFATAPFFAALLARALLKEALRRSTIVALFLALLGIFIMVRESFSLGNWVGDLFALISAFGFAVFAIALRADKSGNSLPVVLLGALFALTLALVISIFSGHGIWIPLNEIVLALCLGAFLLGVGMILCAIGSRAVPAGELALLCMTEVVLAPVWAWLFLAEIPVPSVLMGGSIVIIAIVVNAVTGMRNKPAVASFDVD